MNLVVFMSQLCCKGLKNFRDYQIILHQPNCLEIRLDCLEPERREEVFSEVETKLRAYLNSLGVDEVEIYLSDLLPQATTASGKRRRVYIEQ